MFQFDDSWKGMKFSADNGVVENVVKVAIHFEEFRKRQVYVKDLTVHACVSRGTYLKFMLNSNILSYATFLSVQRNP